MLCFDRYEIKHKNDTERNSGFENLSP
jgi:hypothetical protein